MMRFAAIADVHGNHLALEAVLADIRAQGITDIVNLGDMLSGPLDARRTVEILMQLDAVHVLGNHDRYLLDRPPEKMGSWDRPAHAQLDAAQLDWLRAQPMTRVFRDQVFLCHATPGNDEVYWLDTVHPDGAVALSPLDRIEQLAQGITQSLILCAHTHIARAVRLRDGRLIVNPGSVGSPGFRDVHPFPHVVEAGTPHARYAILDRVGGHWQVTFRHIAYDHVAMAALARRNNQPELANALATGWIKPADDGQVWRNEYAIETSAAAETIWSIFCDVPAWKNWNAGIEQIDIDGPFAAGTWFTMKPPGEAALRSQLIDVRENACFVDETRVGDLAIKVAHRIEQLGPARTRIVYAVDASGAQAAEIGPAVASDFPEVLASLARLAEARAGDK